jgi:hypothetical protein
MSDMQSHTNGPTTTTTPPAATVRDAQLTSMSKPTRQSTLLDVLAKCYSGEMPANYLQFVLRTLYRWSEDDMLKASPVAIATDPLERSKQLLRLHFVHDFQHFGKIVRGENPGEQRGFLIITAAAATDEYDAGNVFRALVNDFGLELRAVLIDSEGARGWFTPVADDLFEGLKHWLSVFKLARKVSLLGEQELPHVPPGESSRLVYLNYATGPE